MSRTALRLLVTAALAATAACGAGGGAPAAPALPPATGSYTAATGYPDVVTYHGDAARTGSYSAAPASRLRPWWQARLDGAVYAQPLQLGTLTIAATEGDSVYALHGGGVVWRRKLGPPVPQSALPCGDVDPLGITGTPVFDPAHAALYVVAEVANPVRHVLYALAPSDGRVLFSRVIDRPGLAPAYQQQRAALAIAHGRVWVAFGGLYGDCGPYRGYLAGVPLSGTGATAFYTVPTAREGGIWAPSGPAVDAGQYLYVAVGNGAATGGAYDGSDSVLKLSGASLVSLFAPSSWANENAGDTDLGSQGPALVAGGAYVFQDGKGGTAYLLSTADLGGVGHPHAAVSLCRSFGGTAYADGVVYVPCTDGVRAVQIGAGGTMSLRWHAPANVNGSPALGGGLLWVPDPADGVLYALDPATGAIRFSAPTGAISRFATPMLHGQGVFMPTLDGVRLWLTS